MTVFWEAESDALEDFEQSPPDINAPSENTINCEDAEDVPRIEMFQMLTEGLRIWDSQSGSVYERLLVRPDELFARYFQKVWKLICIPHYNKCPAELLDYVAWIVGFGPSQGAATKLWSLLETDQKRIMLKIAIKFWKRRGRLDLLSDAIRLFASSIRPRIITWFWRRPLVGEIRIGKDGRPESDLTLVLTEHVEDASETDIYLTLIRVPDLGDLNRDVVEAIADLSRPSNETFEIAYVDFVDTFVDGRNGYWHPVVPEKQATYKAGNGSTEPETLPAMVLAIGSWERIVTPTSLAWTNEMISFVYKPTQTPVVPAPVNVYDFSVFFHSAASDPINGYSLQFLRDAFHFTVKLYRWDAGVETLVVAANMFGVIPNDRLPFAGDAARGVTIDIYKVSATSQHIKVYVDEILILSATETGFGHTEGTVEFRNDTPEVAENEIELSMVEIYQRPLDIVTLSP